VQWEQNIFSRRLEAASVAGGLFQADGPAMGKTPVRTEHSPAMKIERHIFYIVDGDSKGGGKCPPGGDK